MDIIDRNGSVIAVCDRLTALHSVQDVLNLMMTAAYNSSCTALVIFKESLPESFFDLKTGFAGEILQKFSNYRMKLAIVGDFSVYSSKSLRDFIYESNQGQLVFFKSDVEMALDALSQNN